MFNVKRLIKVKVTGRCRRRFSSPHERRPIMQCFCCSMRHWLKTRVRAATYINNQPDQIIISWLLFYCAAREDLGKSFPPLPTGLILRTLCPFNFFILLNGWICLHSVLNQTGSQSVFERTQNHCNFIHSFTYSRKWHRWNYTCRMNDGRKIKSLVFSIGREGQSSTTT